MTRETFAAILLVLACLSALWAFLGLWKARLVLWWAVPEKQTRGRAFAFGAILGATLLATVLFLAPQSPWWLCLTAAAGLLLLLCMLSFFRSTEEELRQQLQEHEKEKEKRRRQKEEARQQREEQKKARKCVTVYSSTSDREYEISPYCITCTCPDWERKRRDAYGIFRCCKHLTFYYTMHEDDIPKSLRRLKSIFPSYGYADKGIPYAGKFAKAGVATDSTGETVYLATGDRFPWVTVYTDLTKGSFNVATGQWGRGKAPYGCRERIGEMLQKEARLSGFAPDDDEWKRPWLREAAAFLGRAPSQEEEAALRKHCGGDRECLYTLRMAAARLAKGERYCVVPRDNRYRSRFEALREGGGATTFTEAHPGLLEALTLAQLRAVGRAAGMEKLGRDKAASCRMLAELPPERLAGAWPASGVDVTDIFRIDLPARPE